MTHFTSKKIRLFTLIANLTNITPSFTKKITSKIVYAKEGFFTTLSRNANCRNVDPLGRLGGLDRMAGLDVLDRGSHGAAVSLVNSRRFFLRLSR